MGKLVTLPEINIPEEDLKLLLAIKLLPDFDS